MSVPTVGEHGTSLGTTVCLYFIGSMRLFMESIALYCAAGALRPETSRPCAASPDASPPAEVLDNVNSAADSGAAKDAAAGADRCLLPLVRVLLPDASAVVNAVTDTVGRTRMRSALHEQRLQFMLFHLSTLSCVTRQRSKSALGSLARVRCTIVFVSGFSISAAMQRKY